MFLPNPILQIIFSYNPFCQREESPDYKSPIFFPETSSEKHKICYYPGIKHITDWSHIPGPWLLSKLNSLHLADKDLYSQFSSVAQSCLTLCNPMNLSTQASLSITNSRSPPKLMPIELVMPSNHLILCHPLLLLPSIFPSIRVFSNELVLHIGWQNYWSFSFNISPSSEYPGLISFRMDWMDLLSVQGTLKSLLQHHSLKASILLHI